MTAGKKKPEVKDPDTPGIERTLRENAEDQLLRSPKSSSDLEGQTPEELIHELEVHKVELETQAEELRRAHIALKESRDKYLDLYEFAPIGYFTLNDKARVTEVNLTGATLLGVERSNLLKAPFSKFVAVQDSDQWHLYFIQVLQNVEKLTCTLTLTRWDGSRFSARVEGIRLNRSDGVTAARITINDISDIWQIDALKSQYSILNGILESTDAAVFSLDSKYCYTSFNSHHAMEMKQLYGADIERGHSFFDYQPVKEDQVRAKHNIDRVLAGEYITDEAFSGEEGRRRRYFEVTQYPIKDTGKNVIGVAVFTQDITERKRAEEELLFSEKKFAAAFQASPNPIAISEIQTGKILDINHAFEDWSGYLWEEMSGKTTRDLNFWVYPEERDLFVGILNTQGYVHKKEVTFRIKKGEFRNILFSAKILATGDKAYMLSLAEDITERRRWEEALQRVNQKLNFLSQLTRQDLTSQIFLLNSYLELAKDQAAGQGPIIESILKGKRAAESIYAITEITKDYQDMGAKPPKWQNVKMAILLGLSHIPLGEIQHSIETEGLEIFADSLLEKAFQRLCESSVKHGDHVTWTRVWHMDTPDRVTIIFEDDGIGIPYEKKEQIFLRSEDATRVSRGSLIFVRDILDITGITIKETGEPGKGARFEMTVPKGAWRIMGNCA